MPDMDTLEEVAQRVRTCNDCALCTSRTNTVPGEGPPHAQIMFVGEGPGYQEDKQGRPFVGMAGRFLEELLASSGIKREEVFIANMVKCRPPNNRDPLPSEISACSKYLDRQIQLIDPKLIVTLGRFSLAKFFPTDTISKVHGRLRKLQGMNIYPMLHPAAALHKKEFKNVIEEDFRAIPNLLKEALDTQRETPENAPPQQLTMF